MCNWRKWIIPGLVTVGLLTMLAGALRSVLVETDLAARSDAGLSPAHSWARVKLDGRDLTLEGTAPSPEAQAEGLSIAGNTYGVRVARDATSLLPLAQPYVFSAERAGNAVILTGNVPSQDARKAVADAVSAAIPGVQISDQLTLSRGAPDGFDDLARFGLSQLGQLEPATVSTSGLELSVRGTAASPDAFNQVNAALAAGLPAGSKLALAEVSPASVSPYTWTFSRDGDVVTLVGFAPGTPEREAAEGQATAAFPGARIVNRLGVAGGAPSGLDWKMASGFALDQLRLLSKGKAIASNADVSFEGVALDAAAFEAASAALSGALPGGIKLAGNTITAPAIVPYVWSLTRPGDGTSALSGYVPDAKTAAANLESASASNPDSGAVSDLQKIGAGAPPNFAAATSVAIINVNRLIAGKADLSGTAISLTGEALSQFAADAIANQLQNGVPPGWSGKAVLTVKASAAPVAPVDCQKELDAILKDEVINFETGSANIKAESAGLLDRLAFALSSCPEALVQIGGHTDSDGSDSGNQLLSENRAKSVVAYLVNSGSNGERFAPQGYGETVPVADNATPEGKAKNRRIEFRINQ